MRRRAIVLFLACLSIISIGCTPLAVPPGPSPLRYRDAVFTDVTTTSNIAYGSAVNAQGQTQTLLLDLYEPTGDSVDSRPAIVWVHGGSFRFGSKTSGELVDQATTFSQKGYVNVSINYRLSPTGCSASAPTVDCVNAIINAKHDAQAAVRFLRANAETYGIDPDRIAISGTSAGAITALNVGYDPTDVGNSGNPGHSSAVRAAVSLSGARVLSTPSAGDAPALLFHGSSDVVVPYQWAVDTVAAAHAAGLVAFLTTWDGAGHVPYSQNRTQIIDETTNFLYWYLGLQTAET
jgi:acetyl esterase/lipase